MMMRHAFDRGVVALAIGKTETTFDGSLRFLDRLLLFVLCADRNVVHAVGEMEEIEHGLDMLACGGNIAQVISCRRFHTVKVSLQSEFLTLFEKLNKLLQVTSLNGFLGNSERWAPAASDRKS